MGARQGRPVLDAVARVDRADRAVVEQRLQRDVDRVEQRVVGAAQAHRDGPSQLGLAVLCAHHRQRLGGVAQVVVARRRGRDGTGVDLAARHGFHHLVFESERHHRGAGAAHHQAGQRVHHHAHAHALAQRLVVGHRRLAGREHQAHTAHLVGHRRAQPALLDARAQDGVHQHVAVDRRSAVARHDPQHLQLQSHALRQCTRDLDLETWQLAAFGGERQCVGVGAQRQLLARLHFGQTGVRARARTRRSPRRPPARASSPVEAHVECGFIASPPA